MLIFLLLALVVPWLFISAYIHDFHSSKTSRRKALLASLGLPSSSKIVGFFHPYCNAGGGGERVLWTAIKAMQRSDPDVVSVVYSGDVDATKEKIIDKVKAGFDITLDPAKLHFVFLRWRYLVEDSTWSHFTLLGQSIGSMVLAYEAMRAIVPDLYIDTMGYAFTFPVVALLSGSSPIPIGAYVHYPTISTNMLARVRSRAEVHTNAETVRRSSVLSEGKLIYYRLFMYLYSGALHFSSFTMANSSWTKNHVDSILTHTDALSSLLFLPASLAFRLVTAFLSNNGEDGKREDVKEARIVYPSCDTRAMSAFKLDGRERVVLSVAQFRPEKDHAAQLRAFHLLLAEHPEHAQGPQGVRLVLLGGSRNADDAMRVAGLKTLANELGIADRVEFVVNASYAEMLRWLSRASVGLSTMVDEHFGINVVEFMAAGVIPVTHASGGPFNDIVVPVDGEPTGFHATTPSSFASALHTALTLSQEADRAIRERARKWAVGRFSEEEFVKGWEASGWRRFLGVRREEGRVEEKLVDVD